MITSSPVNHLAPANYISLGEYLLPARYLLLGVVFVDAFFSTSGYSLLCELWAGAKMAVFARGIQRCAAVPGCSGEVFQALPDELFLSISSQ
jgi:hypothetical protein